MDGETYDNQIWKFDTGLKEFKIQGRVRNIGESSGLISKITNK